MESDKDSNLNLGTEDSVILKHTASELCRLCANTDNQLIPIFKGEGLEHDIPRKLKKHLPTIKISEFDKLPLQICYQCASTLLAWHDLYEGCSLADDRLRTILAVDEKNVKDEVEMDFDDDFRDDDLGESGKSCVDDVNILQPITSMTEADKLLDLNNIECDDTRSSRDITITTERENNNIDRHLENFCIEEDYDGAVVSDLILQKTAITESKNVHVSMQNVSFVCDFCKKNFLSKKKLSHHITKMHNKKILSCDIQIERTPNGKFQCSACKKEFRRKRNASQHFLTHVAEKTVSCDSCEFTCYTKAQLEVHNAKHAKRFCCEICSKMFTYKFLLDTHVQGVHYNMRPFTCNICGKSFKTRYNFGSHMAQHKDIRNFQCPYCSKRCRKSYDLKIHIRTHTKEKPFECSHCRKCFSQNSDRRKHEKRCRTRPSLTQMFEERNCNNNDLTEAISLKMNT